jgi:hypothetical protein
MALGSVLQNQLRPMQPMQAWKGFEVAAPGLLFDLNTDPGETTDAAALHPERLAELQQLHSALTSPNERNGAMP